MTKTSTAPKLNPAAAAILAQITEGSVIFLNGPNGGESTVKEITEKSVYFTNGQYTNKRSLHHYTFIR